MTLSVDFTAEETIGTIPFSVTFIPEISGEPTAYTWTFGDGGTSTERSPTYIYRNTGIYTVKLVITDNVDTVTVKKEDYIVVGKKNFIATPAVGKKPLVVYFEDKSVFPAPYVITRRTWDFGDGTVKTENINTIAHKYLYTGNYDVKLRLKVEGNNG